MVVDPLLKKLNQDDAVMSAKKMKKDKKKAKKLEEKRIAAASQDAVQPDDKANQDKSDTASDNKVFDVSALRQELMADNTFVSKALSLVHIPKHKNQLENQDSDDDGDDEDVDGDDQRPVAGAEPAAKGGGGRAATASQLHEKLQAKLAELRGENFGKGKKKKKAKLSKAEKKAKAKLEKKLKSKLNKKLMNGSTGGAGEGSGGGGSLGGSPGMSPNPHKPVYNSEGKMVFSKFDFANGETVGTKDADTGKKPGPKDPKAALNKIKKHKEKLQSLEAIGKTNRVKTIEEKTAWSAAMAKAEGVKVKDDVDLLKKSIKRMDQKKKKSKEKWESRKEGEDKRKNFKQQKRTDNIAKRKQDKKAKKGGGGGKKAGFR